MRFTLRRYALGAAALVSVVGLAWAADVSTGYNRDGGSYFKSTDRSGPYVIDTGGTATLLGTGSGGGTADSTAANQALQITQETAINTVIGLKTDAKSTATDGTSITWMQVLKQISASAQLSATAANQTTANTSLSTISGQLPAAVGSKADAASLAVTQSTEDKAALAALTTAVGSNGTYLAAIQTAVEVLSALSYTAPDDSTVAAVADSATTSTTCLASNANRQGARFYNNTAQDMWLLEDEGTASNTNFTAKIAPGGLYILPMNTNGVYTDDVKCYWLTNTSDSVLVTEITP